MNQPLRNSVALALNPRRRVRKVRMSNTELIRPKTIMKVRMDRRFHARGCWTCPRSTLSPAMVVPGISDRKFSSRIWRGSSGRNGRKPAEAHAVGHHGKALVEQHDRGRLLGDVDRGVDRDADVGGVQRGGVVDPIAEEADDLMVVPQGTDDAFLVER